MEPLNYLAIGAGTLAAFLAGWLYYSPRLFGHAWATGSGVEINDSPSPTARAMVLQVVALALLALFIGLTAQIEALGMAIAAILAAAFMVVANGAFSGKSGTALLIDGGYVVLSGILMILAQGVL